MAQTQITERQQYWRDHVLAAAAFDGSIVDYATMNNLNTKDIYQWKTSLTKRGFLPVPNTELQSEFTELKLAAAPTEKSSNIFSSVHCRLTLPCGSVLEYFNPIEPDSISQLLSSLRS